MNGLSSEWAHLNELQSRYPGHESQYVYRRFVWLATIEAIGQHDDEFCRTRTSTPQIPSWLQPLIDRELHYADMQIQDRELSNYEANRAFAMVYKAWVLHAAFTIVYRTATQREEPAATPIRAYDRSAPFSLFTLLSPAHRRQYAAVVSSIAQLQPTVMQKEHWLQRGKALE
jgi:hypothetical protein